MIISYLKYLYMRHAYYRTPVPRGMKLMPFHDFCVIDIDPLFLIVDVIGISLALSALFI